MKRFLLPGLLILLMWAGSALSPARAQGVGGQPIVCNQWAQASVAAGTTKLVTGAVGKIINICGFVFSSSGAATGQLVYGTGANCGSNQTVITPVWNITGSQPTGMLNGNATYAVPQLFNPTTAFDLCATIATTTTNVTIVYGQY